MKFPTTLIMPFSESHDGTPDVSQDGVLEVPNTLLPVIAIPEVIRKQEHDSTVTPDLTVYRTTIFKSFAGIVTNAGATNTTFLILDSGIWRINISWHAMTNFPTIGALTAALVVDDNFAGSFNPAQLQATGGVYSESNNMDFTVSIGKGNRWTFRVVISAMGVGQTTAFFTTALASRLG